MSSTNQRQNQAAINQYRRELTEMLDDISSIDNRILNKAVNLGAADVKRNTPVGKYPGGRTGGFMRGSWHVERTEKMGRELSKKLFNSADYSSFVNDGHRLVNKSGVTVGFVRGQHMLEKAIHKVDKALVKEFRKEVERVRQTHDR